jgi:hypothetical protein
MSETLIPAIGLRENSPTLFWAIAVIALSDMAANRIVILFIVRLIVKT